ncbi:MAG TPA: hypothetical protein VIF82_01720 [Burkholderiaceae bacterium]
MRVIEVSSDMRLSELHLLIQGLIGFSDGQLADCFMATRLRGKKIRFMSSKVHADATSLADMNQSLAEIFPTGSRKRLFYSFDFGDNWIFEIKKTAEIAQSAENARYPRIIQEEGVQPI